MGYSGAKHCASNWHGFIHLCMRHLFGQLGLRPLVVIELSYSHALQSVLDRSLKPSFCLQLAHEGVWRKGIFITGTKPKSDDFPWWHETILTGQSANSFLGKVFKLAGTSNATGRGFFTCFANATIALTTHGIWPCNLQIEADCIVAWTTH